MPFLTEEEKAKVDSQIQRLPPTYRRSAEDEALLEQWRAQGGKIAPILKKDGTPKKPKTEPEHDMQCDLFRQFNQRHTELVGLFIAIPNGASLPYKKVKDKMGRTVVKSPLRQKLMDEGLTPGVPDMQLVIARGCYHGLFIENKWGDNKPSANQITQMRRFSEQGYLCLVQYTAPAALQAIEDYLALAPGQEYQPSNSLFKL